MEQRRLILKVLRVDKKEIVFKIERQSHRGMNFHGVSGPCRCFRLGRGSDYIYSASYPSVIRVGSSGDTVGLMVRGELKSSDNKVLRAPCDMFKEHIVPVVLGYNQYYSRNTLTEEDVIWKEED